MTDCKQSIVEAKAVGKRGANIIYESNPFDFGIRSKGKKVYNKKGDMVLVNKETGEVESSVAGFYHVEEVDNAKFVKLFAKGVSAIKGLDKAGQRVFEILCLSIQDSMNKDLVKLSFPDIDQDLTPISKATFTRGKRELVDNGFIASSVHISHYWINPDFVWNGDRLAFVKEYRRSSSKKLP